MIYFWYPETKQLSLEQIDYLFLAEPAGSTALRETTSATPDEVSCPPKIALHPRHGDAEKVPNEASDAACKLVPIDR